MPARRPTHYGQLLGYIAAFLFCVVEDVLLWRGVKRYESIPYVVSAILVTCVVLFVFCAALGAVWTWVRLAATDAWNARQMAARPLGPTSRAVTLVAADPHGAVLDEYWHAVRTAVAEAEAVADAYMEARPSSRSAWGPDNADYVPPPADDLLTGWPGKAAREAERAAA